MIGGDSSRRGTSSSELCVDSDPDDLVPELEFTLMAPNEAGLESREDEPDEWGVGEARGDKFGRARGTIRYECWSAYMHPSESRNNTRLRLTRGGGV